MMFRRHWSGLPKDPSFPSNLKELGYFVNEEDEIRSLEAPESYFKFWLDRNPRINQRQRFAFDQATEEIVHKRLEKEGLEKTTVPLGTPVNEKHVPIFVDKAIETKTRVIVIFGETQKPLGLLAGRVLSGPGGIDNGSMVSVIKELRSQISTPRDSSPPGIILANAGQLYWWPEGKKALTVGASTDIPLPSLVHSRRKFVKELNEIEANETPERHVQHMFEKVLPKILGKHAVVDIVAIERTCEIVERYLDNDDAWAAWGHRLSSILLIDSVLQADALINDHFKHFLTRRSRCYVVSDEPVDMPLAGPSGNQDLCIAPLGMPCYSSGEPCYVECILTTSAHEILSYLERNAVFPDKENDMIEIVPKARNADALDAGVGEKEGSGELTDDHWPKVEDSFQPDVTLVSTEEIEEQRKNMQMWRIFDETGQAPHPDFQKASIEKHTGIGTDEKH